MAASVGSAPTFAERIGAFVGGREPPSFDAIAQALGGKVALWTALRHFMHETYGLEGEWEDGGRRYGWSLRYRRGGRSLTSLAPGVDHLVQLVVVGPSMAEAVAACPLGARFAAALRDAPPHADGRWLFVDLESAEDVQDGERLVVLKSPPPRKARSGRPECREDREGPRVDARSAEASHGGGS